MPKSRILALLTSLSLLVAVGGCITVNPPAVTYIPAVTPTGTPLAPTPAYQSLSFTIPAKGNYSFPIYLRNNETLHLMWRVEGSEDKVWFHIITPSGKSLGFYEDDGHYANGTLEEGFCRGMKEGITQFKPSDYKWGEGYYTMYPTNGAAQAVTLRVEYWIETK